MAFVRKVRNRTLAAFDGVSQCSIKRQVYKGTVELCSAWWKPHAFVFGLDARFDAGPIHWFGWLKSLEEVTGFVVGY